MSLKAQLQHAADVANANNNKTDEWAAPLRRYIRTIREDVRDVANFKGDKDFSTYRKSTMLDQAWGHEERIKHFGQQLYLGYVSRDGYKANGGHVCKFTVGDNASVKDAIEKTSLHLTTLYPEKLEIITRITEDALAHYQVQPQPSLVSKIKAAVFGAPANTHP